MFQLIKGVVSTLSVIPVDPQTLRPDADDTTDADWTTTPYFSKLNDQLVSTFIIQSNNSNTLCEVSLDSGVKPNAGTQTFSITARKSAAGGNQRGIIARLQESGVDRATITQATLDENWTAYSTTTISSITDWTALSVELEGSGTTGGNPANRREVHVADVEFDLP